MSRQPKPPTDILGLPGADRAVPPHVLPAAPFERSRFADIVKSDRQLDDRIADECIGSIDGSECVNEDISLGMIRLGLRDPLA